MFQKTSPLETLNTQRVCLQRRRDIDWSAIEQDYHGYRAGLLSLRELALKHGCSHSAIANFASRHGWPRKHVAKP
jgi:uncharacterized protein YjcR